MQVQFLRFLNLSKWRIFSNSLLFSGKTAFLQISADFVAGFEKFVFHLKARQKRVLIDENNFFCSLIGSGEYAKNTSFKNSQMCFLLFTVYDKVKHVFSTQQENPVDTHFTNIMKFSIIVTSSVMISTIVHNSSLSWE